MSNVGVRVKTEKMWCTKAMELSANRETSNNSPALSREITNNHNNLGSLCGHTYMNLAVPTSGKSNSLGSNALGLYPILQSPIYCGTSVIKLWHTCVNLTSQGMNLCENGGTPNHSFPMLEQNILVHMVLGDLG